jgi:hypothetical protein
VLKKPSVAVPKKKPVTNTVTNPGSKAVVTAAAKTAVKLPGTKVVRKSVLKTTIKPGQKTSTQSVAKSASVSPSKPVDGPPNKSLLDKGVPKPEKTTSKKPAVVTNGMHAHPEITPDSDVFREKVRKPKVVRDSFTMPEAEYAALGEIKKACLKAGYEVKKSELLRVGVALIRKMDIVALKDVLAALQPLKPGRPKNQ